MQNTARENVRAYYDSDEPTLDRILQETDSIIQDMSDMKRRKFLGYRQMLYDKEEKAYNEKIIDPVLLKSADDLADQMAEALCDRNQEEVERIRKELENLIMGLSDGEHSFIQERAENIIIAKAGDCLYDLYENQMEEASNESMEEVVESEEEKEYAEYIALDPKIKEQIIEYSQMAVQAYCKDDYETLMNIQDEFLNDLASTLNVDELWELQNLFDEIYEEGIANCTEE
jgi:hypothetical protein